MPIRTPSAPAKKTSDYLKVGRIDSEYLYDKLIEPSSGTAISTIREFTPTIRFRRTSGRRSPRGLYAQLADQLLAEGDTTRAVEVLELRSYGEFRSSQIRHDYLTTIPLIESYYKAGAFDQGNATPGRLRPESGAVHRPLPAFHRKNQRTRRASTVRQFAESARASSDCRRLRAAGTDRATRSILPVDRTDRSINVERTTYRPPAAVLLPHICGSGCRSRIKPMPRHMLRTCLQAGRIEAG